MISHLKKRLLFRWPIYVHSWGGLGSQLFACLVARRLISRFPKRRVVLIFHSSGVTYRGVELNSKLSSQFSFELHDDYYPRAKSDHHLNKKLSVFSLRRVILRLLIRVGAIARLNEETDFDSLTPFLKEVRGHYSRINIRMEEIQWILDSLDLSGFPETEVGGGYTAMHLRLGDLLTLKPESRIDLDRLIQSKKYFFNSKKLIIYSDSEREEVLRVIENEFDDFDLEIFQFETLKVIACCLYAQVFIGSNSKISLWIAILRLALGVGCSTVLPRDLVMQIKHLSLSIAYTQEALEY